jgi:AmmeMemoRadiSam system protein B
LHSSAWLDDETVLQTFEGEVLRMPLAQDTQYTARRAAVCRPDDLRALAAFCCTNIVALLSGGTASPFLAGAPDGTVSGVIVTLERSGREPIHLCQLSLRPGVSLQSTLVGLCQNAAQVLTDLHAAGQSLDGMEVGVTILHDVALHGTVAEPDLRGVDPRERALLVLERNKSGLVFHPTREPDDLLAEAARQARVRHAHGAGVYSLEALAQGPIVLSTAPRPVRGPNVRASGAAGRFFPAEPAVLARMVDGLVERERRAEVWPAAMVPHAGLTYSGQIAADVLKRLKIPRTVIVIGPKHTPLGVEWAVAPHQTWTFPGGSMPSDPELARQLCDAIPGLELDAAAHQREHAIEVELPLLARLAPESRVLGIAIGAGDLESCRRFASGLADVLRNREDRPLLLISSDMNHYATDAENRRLDAIAIAALETLDPANVYRTVTDNHISMCGVLPAVIVLETLKMLGAGNRSERVGYATSADVTGDTSRVVGYAGMLFA